MANLNGTFDPTQIQPVSFEPMPERWYIGEIVQSSTHATNSGTGHYLKLELDILDSEFAGRKQWDQLNIWNPSARAAQIAQGVLSAIAHAVGVGAFSDTEVLHHKPMMIYLALVNGKNEVKAYKPLQAQKEPSPGRGYAQSTEPTQAQHAVSQAFQQPVTQAPAHSYTNPDGTPMTPQQVQTTMGAPR